MVYNLNNSNGKYKGNWHAYLILVDAVVKCSFVVGRSAILEAFRGVAQPG